ncbi:protein STRUBBELIG-RECEPTOR FAMILY 3-like isoform X2 [Nymphaea colorata]|uniref:protein STRUBBELIG-RECEPTOR FAMILY 3-like isoform X2 n=1 Tax=Nymphaea colorata TaxID=210225 RepID=UPI00129E1FFD|nr:protein STRUBBELIG-RECEPTOR FAMILY 3-like isoform X2 [Nymphaea colorata]
MENAHLKTVWLAFVVLRLFSVLPTSAGLTDVQHVFAINSLYTALGSPPLPGWVASGGDPCVENWQGVQCTGPNITEIILTAANLGGRLGDELGNFTTLTTLQLSNNQIGESIPDNLPPNLQRLFLSANQFTGSIPTTLGELTLLTDMSLNMNHLTGPIPDVFQNLGGLINLDLSSNNLSDHLPATFADLSSLATLKLQNNQLSGTLDVLEDLKLQNLNIENNQFSGPVPPQMLSSIPNFSKDGNPFNVTPPGASPTGPPSPFFSELPATPVTPQNNSEGSSQSIKSHSLSVNRFFTTGRTVGLVFAILLAIGVVILAVCICVSWFRDRPDVISRYEGKDKVPTYREPEKKHPKSEALMQKDCDIVKDGVVRRKMNHVIEMTKVDATYKLPPAEKTTPPSTGEKPDQRLESEKQIYHVPCVASYTGPGPQESSEPKPQKPHVPVPGVVSFTISDLQQFTKSFGQENLIGEGSLGSVYLAELPDRKLLAVKKLDMSTTTMLHADEAFIKLVSTVSKLNHANINKLVGYSVEHGQRILVYEYCTNGTLHDALHLMDEDNKILPWNARIKLALGVARALEYMHEVCQPPLVHRNLKSANVLLDDDFSAHVSDCGLDSIYTGSCASQVSSHMLGSFSYGAPEYTMSGVYNIQSDVYSFGVVMLELLTGRKPLDRRRPRAEQSLVRWAIPQLHDIDALSGMVDPALEGVYSVKSLSRFADIISLCLQPEPEFRPPMSEIVQALVRMTKRESASSRQSCDDSSTSLPDPAQL